MSTWLYAQNPAAESMQLGHGGGVVQRSYLDMLAILPVLLESYRLPELDVEGFAWPTLSVDVPLLRPDRLHAEYRRLIGQGRVT